MDSIIEFGDDMIVAEVVRVFPDRGYMFVENEENGETIYCHISKGCFRLKVTEEGSIIFDHDFITTFMPCAKNRVVLMKAWRQNQNQKRESAIAWAPLTSYQMAMEFLKRTTVFVARVVNLVDNGTAVPDWSEVVFDGNICQLEVLTNEEKERMKTRVEYVLGKNGSTRSISYDTVWFVRRGDQIVECPNPLES